MPKKYIPPLTPAAFEAVEEHLIRGIVAFENSIDVAQSRSKITDYPGDLTEVARLRAMKQGLAWSLNQARQRLKRRGYNG